MQFIFQNCFIGTYKCTFTSLPIHYFFPSSDSAPLSIQASPSPSSSATRQPPLDNDQATREFIDFLKPLKYGRDIFKQCRAFTESMAYKRVSFYWFNCPHLLCNVSDLCFPLSYISLS